MKDKRPIYLSVNPFEYTFPLTALASIAHRISGVFLMFALGYFLYCLYFALGSESGFRAIENMLARPLHELILFLCLSAITYHFILGVKHLLLDFHVGDSIHGSVRATQIAVVLFLICEVVLVTWVW